MRLKRKCGLKMKSFLEIFVSMQVKDGYDLSATRRPCWLAPLILVFWFLCICWVENMSPPIDGDSQINVQDNNIIEEQQHADSRTPLLSADNLQPSSIFQNTRNLLQNWWLWELLASFVSVLSFLSIVVILVVYDSSSLPDWPFVFNVR